MLASEVSLYVLHYFPLALADSGGYENMLVSQQNLGHFSDILSRTGLPPLLPHFLKQSAPYFRLIRRVRSLYLLVGLLLLPFGRPLGIGYPLYNMAYPFVIKDNP